MLSFQSGRMLCFRPDHRVRRAFCNDAGQRRPDESSCYGLFYVRRSPFCSHSPASSANAQAHAAGAALVEAAKKEGKVVWYTTLIVNQRSVR